MGGKGRRGWPQWGIPGIDTFQAETRGPFWVVLGDYSVLAQLQGFLLGWQEVEK